LRTDTYIKFKPVYAEGNEKIYDLATAAAAKR